MDARTCRARPAVLLLSLLVVAGCADDAAGPSGESASVGLEVWYRPAESALRAFASVRVDATGSDGRNAPALLQGQLRFDPGVLRLVGHGTERGGTLAFDIGQASSGHLDVLALNEGGLRGDVGFFVFEVLTEAPPEADLVLDVRRATQVDGARVSVRSLGTRVRSEPPPVSFSSRIEGGVSLPRAEASTLHATAADGGIGDCSGNGVIDFDDVLAVVDIAVRAVPPPPAGSNDFARCDPVVDGMVDYRDVGWTARVWMIVTAGSEPFDEPQDPGPYSGAWYTEDWNYPDLPTAYATGMVQPGGTDGSTQLLRGVSIPGGDSLALRLRYNQVSSRPDQAVGVAVVPHGIDRVRPREFWLETWIRFSGNWNTTTGAAAPSAAPDYQLLVVRDDGGAAADWEWESTVGSGGDGVRMLLGGRDGAPGGGGRTWLFPGGIDALWDGQWHRFRYHASMDAFGTSDSWWVVVDDHPPFHIGSGLDMDRGSERYFRQWAFSGRLARGAPEDMWVDVGPVRMYLSDPGWPRGGSTDPGSGAGEAWYVQDWPTIDGPGIENSTTSGSGQVALLTGLTSTPGGFTRAMRATFVPSGGETQVGLTLKFPDADRDRPRELWIEYHARWSSNWEVDGPFRNGGTCGHKHMFLFDQRETGANGGRWESYIGLFGAIMSQEISGGLAIPADQRRDYQPSHRELWDGEWELLRYHAKMDPVTGVWDMWVNGQKFTWGVGDTDFDPTYYFATMALSRNMNCGVAGTQTLDFGPVRVWTTDPGW